MEEYGSYNWNQQGNEPQNNTPMEPKKQPGKRNGNGARWAKKIGAVALSAVLFGGVAGGVFTGVTYATGATAKAQSTQTDSSKQETTKTTLQTTTSSGSTGSNQRQLQYRRCTAFQKSREQRWHYYWKSCILVIQI